MRAMELEVLDELAELLEKVNADLEPELLTVEGAHAGLARYAHLERLASYGRTVLARKVADASEIARTTGTSIGRAKEAMETGKRLRDADEVDTALKTGTISFEQAAEIARTEESRPGSAPELIDVATNAPFHVLRDRSRRIRLEAEQHRDLPARQHAARGARSHTDELGMIDVHLRFEPHIGTPIVTRAEAEASRRFRKAKKEDRAEPFERHLCDAYAAMLQGSSVKGPSRRPELVVLVSHEVAKRGWKDVREGELCKIPGVGPVSPRVAKEIADDAFISGVLYDGRDLRHFRRWTRNVPIGVRLALELGEPPAFDGIACTDCGNRFRTETDHVDPHVALGPASVDNLEPRCWSCHKAKTERDRRAGKLRHKKRGPP
jgi:hypothetical protein